jgi:hypothetical protein
MAYERLLVADYRPSTTQQHERIASDFLPAARCRIKRARFAGKYTPPCIYINANENIRETSHFS